MKMRLFASVLAGGAIVSCASAFTLSLAPAYNWYHGCGPTAAGSIIGFWDVRGYDNLFTASGWDQVKLTSNVQDQISSPEHNAKYDPTPDRTDLATPAKTSIADWFMTSVDPLQFGWAYLSYAPSALKDYAAYRGYTSTAGNWSYGYDLTWNSLVGELNAGKPLMFLVDSDGDGGTDHFVPVYGYEDRGAAGKYYACYTTWTENESLEWYQFRGMSNAYTWGVGYATYFHPVPEPLTVIFLGLAGIGIAARKRRKS